MTDAAQTTAEFKGASQNIKMFGAISGDNTAGATNRAALASALASAVYLEIPAGDYYFDNSAGWLQVTNFSGHVKFHGNARLVATDNTLGVIRFNGGTRATIEGLRIGYQTQCAVRGSNTSNTVFVYEAEAFTLSDCVVEDSPGAAIWFSSCPRAKAVNVDVWRAKADGLHFENCQDITVNNVTTDSTEDDGLALTNLVAEPDANGAVISNIITRNVQVAHGIAVVGYSDVTISNFVIENTSATGLIVISGDNLTTYRICNRVKVSNGIVRNAGQLATRAPNGYGVEFNNTASVDFENIDIYNSYNQGFAGYAPTGRVNAKNIYVEGTTATDQNGVTLEAQYVEASNITVKDAKRYGFCAINADRVIVRDIKAINCAVNDLNHRAIWFEGNDYLFADQLLAIDTQLTATGYVIGESGHVAGIMSNLGFSILNGSSAIDYNSAGVLLTLTQDGSLLLDDVTRQLTTALPMTTRRIHTIKQNSGDSGGPYLTLDADAGASGRKYRIVSTATGDAGGAGGILIQDITITGGGEIDRMFFASNGETAIGPKHLSPAATLDVRNATATTGKTKLRVKAGPGDGAADWLFEVADAADNPLLRFYQSGILRLVALAGTSRPARISAAGEIGGGQIALTSTDEVAMGSIPNGAVLINSAGKVGALAALTASKNVVTDASGALAVQTLTASAPMWTDGAGLPGTTNAASIVSYLQSALETAGFVTTTAMATYTYSKAESDMAYTPAATFGSHTHTTDSHTHGGVTAGTDTSGTGGGGSTSTP